MMVSGGYDKRIMLWNINQKMAKIPLKGHQDWVTVSLLGVILDKNLQISKISDEFIYVIPLSPFA